MLDLSYCGRPLTRIDSTSVTAVDHKRQDYQTKYKNPRVEAVEILADVSKTFMCRNFQHFLQTPKDIVYSFENSD